LRLAAGLEAEADRRDHLVTVEIDVGLHTQTKLLVADG
jgi:hypothetical protein